MQHIKLIFGTHRVNKFFFCYSKKYLIWQCFEGFMVANSSVGFIKLNICSFVVTFAPSLLHMCSQLSKNICLKIITIEELLYLWHPSKEHCFTNALRKTYFCYFFATFYLLTSAKWLVSDDLKYSRNLAHAHL